MHQYLDNLKDKGWNSQSNLMITLNNNYPVVKFGITILNEIHFQNFNELTLKKL